MTLAPWRPVLARALHGNRARAHCRYFQLATINANGKPSNRTVVFRGFVGEALQMVTDGRSEKVQQVQVAPWAEACWYFTVTREQFRIAGKLSLINGENDGDTIRLKAWQALSANGRQQFYGPAPGQARDRTAAAAMMAESTEQPPDSFNILLLTPDRVDHLVLRGNPQERCIYGYATNKWTVQEVNP